MRCSHEDCIAADAVHVDTGSSLHVVQVNISVLGDQVDHIVLLSDL